jgi:hypothetical protein
MQTLQSIESQEQALVESFKSKLFGNWIKSGITNPIKFMKVFFLYGMYSSSPYKWKDLIYNGFRTFDGVHNTAEFEELEKSRNALIEQILQAKVLPSYVNEDVIGCQTLSSIWPHRRLRPEMGDLSSYGAKCYYSSSGLILPELIDGEQYLISVCVFKNDKTFEYRWVRFRPITFFGWDRSNLDLSLLTSTYGYTGVANIYDVEDIECNNLIIQGTFYMQVTFDNQSSYTLDGSQQYQVNTSMTFNSSRA